MTDSRFSPEVARRIADRLVGQCLDGFDEAIEAETGEALNDCPAEFLAEVDSLVFCCDGCGWYCSTDELNNEGDEQLCDQCNAEENG